MIHRPLFVVLALGLAGVAQARDELRTVDDLSLISLRADVASVDRRFDYPGINGPHGFDNPDCLVLTTDDDVLGGLHTDALTRLSEGLEVLDGDGILFAGDGRELNVLSATLDEAPRHLLYHLKDLSKYVTGLRVKTRDGSTLQQLTDRVGFKGLVALEMVRGCRIARKPGP